MTYIHICCFLRQDDVQATGLFIYSGETDTFQFDLHISYMTLGPILS